MEISPAKCGCLPKGTFTDHAGEECSIQDASCCEESILLGIDKPTAHAITSRGWDAIPLPNDAHVQGRMLLTRKMVRELMRHLTRFVATGTIYGVDGKQEGNTPEAAIRVICGEVARIVVWDKTVGQEPYHSAHEGYAILLEAMDALKQEVWRHRLGEDLRKRAMCVAADAVRFVNDVVQK